MPSAQVRLWNVETGECDVTLSGHKSAVTALRFNASGAQLASGAQDTDIVVWDVVAQVGLFRLRGHHGQVGNDLCSVVKADPLPISAPSLTVGMQVLMPPSLIGQRDLHSPSATPPSVSSRLCVH